MTPRLNKHPFMALFDGPDPNKSTEQRATSTVALQALSFMNGPFMKEKSTALARRLGDISSDPQVRLTQGYELVFGRLPEPHERAEAEDYLSSYRSQLEADGCSADEADKLAWASLARILLSSNEFVYVD